MYILVLCFIILDLSVDSKEIRKKRGMDVIERRRMIRILEEMRQNPEYSNRLGIKDKSVFKPAQYESRGRRNDKE